MGCAARLTACSSRIAAPGRAAELAAELGGEAVASNAELAERADVVVLAVKPAKLDQAAAELAAAKVVVSLLGATSLETSRERLSRCRGRAGDAERRGRGAQGRALRRGRAAMRGCGACSRGLGTWSTWTMPNSMRRPR